MNFDSIQTWTAVVTPFTEQGAVDYDSFETLLRKQEAAEVGIVILGSTGEGLNLRSEEKQEIVRWASGLGLRVPLIVSVGGHLIDECLDWVRQCNDLPIHGYLVVAPLYAKPGVQGQINWFQSILDTANHPCMIYNVPSRTGVEIPFATVEALKDHTNFWAFKEASGSIQKFSKYRQILTRQKVYSGDDGLMPYFAAAGADGVVSVAANVWPVATQKFVERCLAGDWKDMIAVWEQATDLLFCASNPVPAKFLLAHRREIARADVRAPLSLDDLSEENQANLIEINQHIENWSRQ